MFFGFGVDEQTGPKRWSGLSYECFSLSFSTSLKLRQVLCICSRREWMQRLDVYCEESAVHTCLDAIRKVLTKVIKI